MSLYNLVRPLAFMMDAEAAHDLGLKLIASGVVKGCAAPAMPVSALGLEFPNPIGLAAGFDKNALLLNSWKNFGFGFIEVGTITRHPQPGNPRPRLFRYPESRALINRLGFNNDGAEAIASRLGQRPNGLIVGANIGKSRVTELEDAPSDYAFTYRLVAPHADYVTINVSSPNTPGLRELQDADALKRIISALKEIDDAKPLLVKIAPDLSEEQIADVASLASELNLSGVIATNTTTTRPGGIGSNQPQGGLSGQPLNDLAQSTLECLAKHLDKDKVIVGVGGIETAEQAKKRIEAGANLLQVYTGFVYGGPNFPADLVSGLLALD